MAPAATVAIEPLARALEKVFMIRFLLTDRTVQSGDEGQIPNRGWHEPELCRQVLFIFKATLLNGGTGLRKALTIAP
jgi:hypothetical protein